MKFVAIPENEGRSFKFWQDGEIFDGLTVPQGLFRRLYIFRLDQKQQAYELADELKRRRVEAVITYSNQDYVLWASLQSYWWRLPEQERCQLLLTASHLC